MKILSHALKTYPLLLLLSSFIEHVFCVECSDVLFCSLSHGSVWKPASYLVFQSVVYNLIFGVLLVLFINLIYCELWSKQKYFLEERGVRRKRFCEFCLFALGGMVFTSFSSSVFICTGRYISLVVPVPNRASSWYATVLARVRSARLLAGLGGDHGAVRLLEQILELEGLDEVGVPDHGAVGDDGMKIEGTVR